MPFFAFEREFLPTPTVELPAVIDAEPQWPTTDMDDPNVKAEKRRAAEVAFQRSETNRTSQQRPGQWQPPLTADQLAHVLDLMRKKM